MPALFELKSEISPAAVDAIDDLLLENGLENWSLLQDIIINRAWLVGIFPNADSARASWSELLPLLPAEAAPATRDFADYDLTFDGKPIEVTKPEAPIAATENVKLHRKL
jgi:ribosomal protein L11 methyltransferase